MRLAVTILFLFLAAALLHAQARHPGIGLYEQGKYAEAESSLKAASKSPEHKDDPQVWNYLGLSYLARQNTGDALKAFKKSISLSPNNSLLHSNLAFAYLAEAQLQKALDAAAKAVALDSKNGSAYHARSTVNYRANRLELAMQDVNKFIELERTNPDAYLLKSSIVLGQLAASEGTASQQVAFLKLTVGVLESCIKDCKEGPQLQSVREELESASAFLSYFVRRESESSTDTAKQKIRPPRVIDRPQAGYTDFARMNNVIGRVQISVMLEADGKVSHTLLLRRLGFGLDEHAKAAAKMIRFEPKTVEGKPVVAVLRIEYEFSTY